MRGDGSVAGEGRVVGTPKFHSWVKCTMPLTNINVQRFFWPVYYIIYAGPLTCILGCNVWWQDYIRLFLLVLGPVQWRRNRSGRSGFGRYTF